MALGERGQPRSTTPHPSAFPEKPLRLFCVETLWDVAQIYETERGSGQKAALTKDLDAPVLIEGPSPIRLAPKLDSPPEIS